MARLCTDDQMKRSRRTVEVGVGAVAKQAGCLVNTAHLRPCGARQCRRAAMWLSHNYERVIPGRFR
jgi:hypothetical protein